MKLKTLSLLSAAIGMSAPLASAAISIVNVVDGDLGSTASQSITYTPTTAGNVLVIATYVDKGTPSYSSVLFDGVAATGQTSTGRTMLAYTYTSDASVTISFSNAADTNSSYVIYELSGVDTSQTAILSNTSSLTTTDANQFVVNAQGANVNDADLISATPSSGSVVTDSDYYARGSGSLVYGSGTAATAGTQTLGWTVTSTSGAYTGLAADGQVSVAFFAVPEPSVVLLGAFGATTLLRRRRA
jgi:hypothetical protein